MPPNEKPSPVLQPQKMTPPAPGTGASRLQWRGFALGLAALVFFLGTPLYRLAAFAWHDELYSYIILMPFVAAYLVHLKKPALKSAPDSAPLRGTGLALLLAGAA